MNTEVPGGLGVQVCHLGDVHTFLIQVSPTPTNIFMFHIFCVAYTVTQRKTTGAKRNLVFLLFFSSTAEVNNFIENQSNPT